MTAKDRLKIYLRSYPGRLIRTSEIIRWGANGGYSNRAARNARELCNEGFLRRLTKFEAQLNGFTGNEGIYKIIEKI